MTPEQYAETLATRLYLQVGAFFTNTRRGAPGTCVTCTGPATGPSCPQCRHPQEVYGSELADLVVPLAYAKGWMRPIHQCCGYVGCGHLRTVQAVAGPDPPVAGLARQSAALALKAAGAVRVTVLCAARWLSYEWPEHREFIDSLDEPYDARRCPVTGDACP